MNWLKTLINRQASARRFNPWSVLVCSEPQMGSIKRGSIAA